MEVNGLTSWVRTCRFRFQAQWNSRSMRLGTLVLLGATLVSGPVWGAESDKNKKQDQTRTRSLTGVVLDVEGKPVAGAVVQLEDTKTLQIRSYYTGKDGSYHFAGLSPDVNYTILALRDGMRTGKKILSNFNSSKTPAIKLKFKK